MALAPAQLPRCHAQEGQRLFGLRCPVEETLSLPRLMRQGGKTTGGGSMVGRVWNSDAEAAPASAALSPFPDACDNPRGCRTIAMHQAGDARDRKRGGWGKGG